MIKSCEYEDINKADCINCFNGLPKNECKYYEEIERKKLRQMVHERAEIVRKKEYNKAIDDFVKEISKVKYSSENYDKYGYNDDYYDVVCFDDIEKIAEQLKVGDQNEQSI